MRPALFDDHENFAVFGDAITTSWDAPTTFKGKASYTVTFTATKSGKLSEMLSVSSRITKVLAFDSANKMNVAFRFSNGGNSTIAGVGFELYQNAPNPFVNKTFVGFHLPEAISATLSVYDETGRVLYTTTGDFGKGYNAIALDRTTLNANGVLYYKLETTTDSATKKMIQTSK